MRSRVSGKQAALLSLLLTVATTATGVALAAPDPHQVVDESPVTGSIRESAGPARGASDQVLPWGPTATEMARARELVSMWSLDQLAGQVIVGRFVGTDPAAAGRLVTDYHLAGLCITKDNVVDASQVLALNAAVTQAVEADRGVAPILGADQEGGRVAHLDAVATPFPAFAEAGEALAADDREGGDTGRRAIRQAAYAAGLEMRSLGFTWVFAPDADVTIGSADPTIGDRSPSPDARLAARAVTAALDGYTAAGLVPTLKHFPGHGSATQDTHEGVVPLTASKEQLDTRDLVPFRAGIAAGAPVIMMSHLDVEAIAPGQPASVQPAMYDFLRHLGFEGVVMTDSLGMGAMAGQDAPAVEALEAGADLVLMPAVTSAAHDNIVRAVEDGSLPLMRLQDAATRVVALTLWQQRVAAARALPADVTAAAQAASAALDLAARR